MTFIDKLTGNYSGVLEELDCNLPQTTLLEASGSSAVISKNSETEVNVSLTTPLGELYNFNATFATDSTFTVTQFEQDGNTYIGTIKLIDDLSVLLNNGCVIFGTQAVTTRFTEN